MKKRLTSFKMSDIMIRQAKNDAKVPNPSPIKICCQIGQPLKKTWNNVTVKK